MRINRSLFNWGVFFIALGGVPLAVEQGWLEADIASDLGRLWPLILVGIGLGLILRWTPLSWFGGALVAATFGIIVGAAAVSLRDDDLADAWRIIPAIAIGACAGGDVGTGSTLESGAATSDAFRLGVDFSCGDLAVSRSDGTDWRLEGAHDVAGTPLIVEDSRDGLTAGVQLNQERDDNLAFFGRRHPSRWSVAVPAEAALTVETTLNAADGTYDTGDGPLDRFAGTFNAADVVLDMGGATTPGTASVDLTLNASGGRLLFPATGRFEASSTLNASSLVACVPEAAALQVHISETLASSDIGESGLEQIDDSTWATPDYSESDDHVLLEVSSTASSLDLERPEACS
jgi:hypothetical protein